MIKTRISLRAVRIKGKLELHQRPVIGPSTKFESISERLSPFGGLLGLVKFMDLVRFKEIFDGLYLAPFRKPVLGHYNMVYGLLILLFIGFNRVWHFLFIQFDSMICSIFNVVKLPYVTTYWRYVNSLHKSGQNIFVDYERS